MLDYHGAETHFLAKEVRKAFPLPLNTLPPLDPSIRESARVLAFRLDCLANEATQDVNFPDYHEVEKGVKAYFGGRIPSESLVHMAGDLEIIAEDDGRFVPCVQHPCFTLSLFLRVLSGHLTPIAQPITA